jgi:hypothetical protein
MPWPDKRTGPAATLTPSHAVPAPTSTTESLPHRDDHERARQVRRLATIELTRMLYGPVADLRPTPPGPAVCPASCRYCPGRRAA